ncbi:MAG TPA: GTPase HflX [Terriglobia bacterium]|nr:GTPase HflX [Terriglobia bacterium]
MEKTLLVSWTPNRRGDGRAGTVEEIDGPGAPAGQDGEEGLQELTELVASAGARVLGAVRQRSPHPDPATLVGRGKVEEVRAMAQGAGADAVIFDQDLTPTQLRNLESALDLKVIDRTQLILDIFARRARTREGQLQVELAQLNYLLPRLAGRGTLLSRLGGGIGTRGPGEQQLEFDRRRIRTRIRKLHDAIERVRSGRALHRAHRLERQFLTVALVGYTNAGKSTLFNALTRARVMTSGRLFATLDPTVRRLPLESRRSVVLSDTVGFIRNLPPHLVASFRATLEELEGASLLLHVTDASHPRHEQQDAAVESLLETLGLASAPRLHVWNKSDLLEAAEIKRRSAGAMEVAVSAATGQGLETLRRRIDEALADDPVVEAEFKLSSSDAQGLALLYRFGTVLSAEYGDDQVSVRARVTTSLRRRVEAAR